MITDKAPFVAKMRAEIDRIAAAEHRPIRCGHNDARAEERQDE